MKKLLPNTLLTAALVLAGAARLCAGPLTYREAAAPWNALQAAELAPRLTPAFLKSVEAGHGPRAAAALAEKRDRVAGLAERLRTCALNGGDLETARKYFVPEFAEEIAYFSGPGCEEFRRSAEGLARQASSAYADHAAASAASGSLATREGANAFFHGSAAAGAAPEVRAAAASAAAAGAGPAAPRDNRPLSARVPLPPSVRAAVTAPERPADLGKDGRVHRAMAYWLEMRRENWSAIKGGELKGGAKAAAAGKLAAGAFFHGLLWVSNLDNVEIAAARLGWDVGQGAGAGVIAADAAKLAFHSMVFVMLVAPVPVTKVARAALAGEPWAVAFVGAMAAGPLNRYWLHFAD